MPTEIYHIIPRLGIPEATGLRILLHTYVFHEIRGKPQSRTIFNDWAGKFTIETFNNEVIEIENLAVGDYALKVYGHAGSTNAYRVFLSSGASQSSEFTDNDDYDIPDGGDEPGVYTTPAIRFPNVPAGSVVRKLKLKQLDINHRCLGDLQVTLLWDGVPITTLWNRDGENCDDAGLDDDSLTSIGCSSFSGIFGRDICFENRFYPAFDDNDPNQPLFQNSFDPMFAGLDAQGELTVEIKDYVSNNVGKLVNVQFELEYFIP